MDNKKKLEELYKKLELYKDTPPNNATEDFFIYPDTMQDIGMMQDPSSIAVLLSHLDDDYPYDYVQGNLMGVLENYPDEMYIPEFFKNLELILPRALKSASELLIGIFNDKKCHKIVRENSKLAEHESLLKVLDCVEKYWEFDPNKMILLRQLVLGDASKKEDEQSTSSSDEI